MLCAELQTRQYNAPQEDVLRAMMTCTLAHILIHTHTFSITSLYAVANHIHAVSTM